MKHHNLKKKNDTLRVLNTTFRKKDQDAKKQMDHGTEMLIYSNIVRDSFVSCVYIKTYAISPFIYPASCKLSYVLYLFLTI